MPTMQQPDRRHFLQTTFGATAFAALAGSLTADDKVKDEKRFKKAVKIGMVKVKGSLSDKFEVLKKLGFDGVELNSPGGPTPSEVDRAKEVSGLPVHGVVDSVHWRDTLSHPDAEVRARGVEALKTALRHSKEYGGTSVLLVPAKVDKLASYDECWKRSIPEIRKAIPLAEDLGIDILLENVWNGFLTDPKETAKYVDELDSERVGAYYDVGNSVRYAPPVEWITTLGQRIKKLDIKEYDLEKGKSEGWYKGFQVKLLEGTCGWPSVMKTLKEIGFSGWGTAEIPGGDKERLAEIAERMDKIFAS